MLVNGYLAGDLPDYQLSAFLMACYFRGMTGEETMAFTEIMLHSGKIVDLSAIPGIKVDKHSTGGVGDKVSLIAAPIAAACGVPVPMISGRSLGHTGGTLDKLEAIPGFRTNLSITEYKQVIAKTGLVMIGQTKEIAPADKKLYALRDVTATIECIPLIAASIMSKKLAEGIDALVLDVKTGRGAFMKNYEDAGKLASVLVDIGQRFGKETVGFITDMSQPLGVAIGNWTEVVESVECLRGERGTNDSSSDLMEVTHVLSGAMLLLGKKAATLEEGMERSKKAISDGSAYRKFLELVSAQGGTVEAIENLEGYPFSAHSIELKADQDGFVAGIDPLETGLTAVALGAGRTKIDEPVDPKAGIVLKKKVGDAVETGETLAVFFTEREEAISASRVRLAKAFQITPQKPPKKKSILAQVTASGIQPL
jgi:pyrimidine-nucleoside phosphorylase